MADCCAEEGDGEEHIREDILLETPSFMSSLQVFSSVGGLALLAEHLPLLYPEFTRQATPIEVTKDPGAMQGLGHDWVTVESAEEIYEASEALLSIFLICLSCLRWIILMVH